MIHNEIMSCTNQENKCVKLFRSFFAATSPLNLIIKLQSLLGIMGLNVDTDTGVDIGVDIGLWP